MWIQTKSLSIVLGLSLALGVGAAAADPNPVDYSVYFYADVRDQAQCNLEVDGGQLVFKGISNPAMSCPDAFSWKLFLDAVQDRFWIRWAADEYTWPQQKIAGLPSDRSWGPLPLCPDGKRGPECCAPGNRNNPGYSNVIYPAQNCPYFPGEFEAAGVQRPKRMGRPPSKTHAAHLESVLSRSVSTPADIEPGRVIRQEVSELVFRNKPLFDYVFRNGLYHAETLGAAFERNDANLANDAPYWARNKSRNPVRIDFPAESMMIKSNWLLDAKLKQLIREGVIPRDHAPFISMEILSPVMDNNAQTFKPGLHHLVAFHISSRDTPHWVWATFEHVNNPGRCDYTGCNDGFGYTSPDAVDAAEHNNFTTPKTTSDNLLIPETVFQLAGQYGGGSRRPALQKIFDARGIGTPGKQDNQPRATDAAWGSYRLKGSQVTFTDSLGRSTYLGNSVIEGGFVNSSSCMTCHARASVNQQGASPLGVFVFRLSEAGYRLSANGLPDPNWFHTDTLARPQLNALQTDFVWGFLNAQPLRKTGGGSR